VLKSRLEQARERLRHRLIARGLTLPCGFGAFFLLEGTTGATVPPALIVPTTKAAIAVAAGNALSTVVTAKVAALAEGVLKTMLLTKIKTALAMVLVLAALGAGVFSLASSGPTGEQPAPALPQRFEPNADAGTKLGWDALRLGHFSGALTPDGKKVVTLSTGAVVHIFDATTGRLLERRLLGDRRDLCPDTWYFSLSADGSVAVVSEQTSIPRMTAWTVATGRQLVRLGPVSSHALSSDGRSLAAVELVADRGEYVLRVYDLETGKPRDVARAGNLSHLRFTPDGKRLLGHVAGGQADEIVCYDVGDAKRLWAVSPGAAEIGVTPDSRIAFLAKPGAKEPFRAIDLETGKPAEAVKLPTCEAAGEPALAGDRLLLAPLRTGEVAVWDYRAGKELRRLRATPRDFLSVRVFAAADGKTALTDGDALRRWDLATGEQIFGPSGEPAHFGVVQALAFLPGGGLLSSSAGGELRRWDIAGGRPVGEPGRAAGSEVRVTRAGVRMVKAEWSHDLIVEDRAGKRVGKVTLPHDSTPLTADLFWKYALLSDGRTAVAFVPRQGKAPVVAVTDYVAGKVLAQHEVDLPVEERGTHFQSFAPCGRWLAVNGQVFAVSTGKPVWAPSAGEGWEMWKQSTATFSPDGRLLCCRVSVSSSPKKEDFERGEHDVWEVASGARLARLEAKQISRVAFSPDNRTLAYVTGFGVHLVDLGTGKLLAEYEDPGIICANYLTGPAATVVFAPDSRTVATGHHDGSILVWKVPQPAPAKLTKAEREAAWDDLASTDAAKARGAVDRLACEPEAAVALLSERFKAPMVRANEDVSALIRALDSEAFAERERASRQLREVGLKAESALREALKEATPEVKRRIEKLLEALDATRLPLTNTEALRGVRAIEVLERARIPAAKTLLQSWADQPAEPRLAAEARVAVERLRLGDSYR
jgi:WD40 repeat protein